MVALRVAIEGDEEEESLSDCKDRDTMLRESKIKKEQRKMNENKRKHIMNCIENSHELGVLKLLSTYAILMMEHSKLSCTLPYNIINISSYN